MSAPRLHLELFGGLRARVNGNPPRELSRQQSGALLAFLALNAGRSFAREELIDLFWHEDDLEEGRRRLRQAIYNVRRTVQDTALDPDSLFSNSRDTIQLNAAVVCVDVHEFESAIRQAGASTEPADRLAHLLRADELYRGDLLPGFYQDAFDFERGRLQVQRRKVLCELSRAYIAVGKNDLAINTAQRLVAVDPLVEEAHADLMRLYACSGRPSEVRRQYRELEKVLAAELGVAPTEAVRELAERLRAEAELGPALQPANGNHEAPTQQRAPSRRPLRCFQIAAVACAATLTFLGLTSMLGKAHRYSVIDLGTFGGEGGAPAALNSSGLVVGIAHNGRHMEGSLWLADGGIRRLPDLGKVTNGASGVNDSGQVIGVSTDGNGGAHAVLWDRVGSHLIGNNLSPEGINAEGTVAGYFNTDRPEYLRACIWKSAGGLHSLGTLGGVSMARDININEYVVGFFRDSRGFGRAFVWSKEHEMMDLGTLGGDNADAQGINDAGQIVGKAQPAGNGPMHAFLYDQYHGMQDIGPSNEFSEASKINNHGQVVGQYGGRDGRAFIWTASQGPIDLNTLLDSTGSEWVLNSASDINDSGWIVGAGTYKGHLRPFLLKPVDAKPLVPEQIPQTVLSSSR